MTRSPPFFAYLQRAAIAALFLVVTPACDAPATRSLGPVADDAWRPFSDDSPWNTRIAPNAPKDAQSAARMAEFSKHGGLYINIENWSVPIYEVNFPDTPKASPLDLFPGRIGRGFDHPRVIPIPDGAKAAGPEGGTGYLCIIDKQRGLEWGLRQAEKREDGNWYIGFGAISNLKGNGVARPWTEEKDPYAAESAMPAGFPLIAGVLRLEDIRAGEIRHALLVATPAAVMDEFVPPASTAQTPGLAAYPENGLPLGARLQLDKRFNVDAAPLSPAAKMIARALQDYGAIVGDTAGANVLFAESSPEALKAWPSLLKPEDLQAVFSPEMMAKHFHVLELGEVSPGRAAEAPKPE